MRRIIIAMLLSLLVMLPSYTYLYLCGMRDGIASYKRSKEFQLTLYSAYRFGLMDGCTDDSVCDRYGFGSGDEGGHR